MRSFCTRSRWQRGVQAWALGVVMACLAVPAHGALEGGKWYRYRSANFDVYSKLREGDVARRIHDLEAFRAVIHWFLQVDSPKSFDHTTKLLLLPRRSDVRKLFGMSGDVVGLMIPGLRSNLMVASPAQLAIDNEVVFHEYVHYVVRNVSSFRYPPWFNEGFAEVLATVSIDDERVTIGRIPLYRARTIVGDRRMRLERLMSTDATLELSGRRASRFYATAWLLVHYLTLADQHSGGPEARRALTAYLEDYNAGVAEGADFAKHLGVPLTQLEMALNRYERAVPYLQVPLDRFAFDGQYRRKRLEPSEVAYELGYATVAYEPRYARKLFNRILREDPEHPRALAGLGVSHQFEGEYDEAEQLMRHAIALDEDDYVLLIELADLLQARCEESESDPECADPDLKREAEELYRRAWQREPENLETLARYGAILLRNDEPEQALPLLEQAYRLSPSTYEIVVDLGTAYAGNGYWADAKALLTRAVGWSVDDPEEHARVKSLLAAVEQTSSAWSATGTPATPP